MTRVPRDVSGTDLVRMLGHRGYVVVRQTGSHARLTRRAAGVERHLTVPMHDPVKVGTLRGILAEAAQQIGIDVDDLIADL